MKDMPLNTSQQDAAQKIFQWMECTMTTANDDDSQKKDGHPDGIALPPHERECGRAHPIRGTSHEDLTDWCMQHET